MKVVKIFSILVLIMMSLACQAQNLSNYTKDKKAIKSFNKAVVYMERGQKNYAIAEVDKAIKRDPNFLEAYLLKAEIADFWGETQQAFENYSKVFEIDPDYDPGLTFKLAINSFSVGKYGKAKEYIDYFYANADVKKYAKYNTDRLRTYIYFADSSYNNPVDFEPMNVGRGVNSDFDEYWPSLSVDESVLVFTRQIPINPNSSARNPESMQEDLYVSFYSVLALLLP